MDGARTAPSAPTGTVTLVLGDLERSVTHWEADREAMAVAIGRIDEIVDGSVARHRGHRPAEQGEGDSFVVTFSRAGDAVAFAADLQRALSAEAWPGARPMAVRVGVHTGDIEARDDGRYLGPTVNRCARLRDLGHGGQTLVSGVTRALVADHLPPDTALRYLGACELRGVVDPMEVHQLDVDGLPDDFPPLEVQTPPPLPAALTTFVGRSAERDEVAQRLASTRLVTITGAGGSGKTRLALEVTRSQPRAAWVDLAALRKPDLVPKEIAEVVGARPSAEDPIPEIITRLRTGPMLLVVDNCEHLLDACARTARALLEGCPDLTILATSREPLGLTGEAVFRIPSLSPAEASTLFVDRARLVAADFELTPDNAGAVTRICARLDGLPLAIELAAARMRSLSLDQLVEGLDERFRLLTGGGRDALPRQRTLEASVEWSFDLLTEVERTVLVRLSVFTGSFSLDGAEVVAAGRGVPGADVGDLVTSLADRSLVQVERVAGTSRYRLLETVHVYARSRLRELDDAAAVRDRHVEWAKQLAAAGGVGWVVDVDRWHPILTAEVDNLRTAIAWALEHGRGTDVIDIVEPLGTYWGSSRMFAELYPILRAALDAPELTADARLRALTVTTSLAAYSGDMAAGHEFACEWVERAAAVDAPELIALAHCMRAWTATYALRGSNEQIHTDLDRAIAAAAQIEETELQAELLTYIGSTQTVWQSPHVARRTLRKAIDVAARSEGFTLTGLLARGYLIPCALDGEVDESLERAREVLNLARTMGADVLTAFASWTLGLVLTFLGREEEARQAIDEAFEPARRCRLRLQMHFVQRTEAVFEYRFGDPLTALAAAEALRIPDSWSDNSEALVCTLFEGAAARRASDRERARALLTDVRERSVDPRFVLTGALASMNLAMLALDEADLDAAWEHGHDALTTSADGDLMPCVLDALDLLAEMSAGTSGAELTARVLGATDRWRAELGMPPFDLEPGRRDATVDAVRAALGDAFDGLFAEGRALDLTEAVAYVRRGRGQRGRPSSGWASLTPAELDVVRLVADGLQNAQIAEALFISANTVKTHLAHVYTKLGSSSRAEVAAEAARRL